ncbi:MAG: metallophosphoesterase [Vicinamibacterales bacterium]
MRPICWIHISDIHMRVSAAWSQDVVLTAMCDDVLRQRKAGLAADFILATGDLAFSGKADEYRLAQGLFDALSAASGVPKERIFCIPGNHDIDRSRQNMAFQGVRSFVQSQNQIDQLLSPEDDIATLLLRQQNYRAFQEAYFNGQDRKRTADGLAYVAGITIDDVRLAIVGLDSAWLAAGGPEDHGKLLIGERQVINAFDLARTLDPHLVIGMAHHPFHVLQDIDRRPAQRRVESACAFFHCGHLHEPEAQMAGFTASGCLTLAAGASFETRQSRNSYSFVTLDLLRAERTVTTVQYSPTTSAFSSTAHDSYPIDIAPAGICPVNDLAIAMREYTPALASLAHYLSALLLDQKSELAIPSGKKYAFGSFAVLQDQPGSDFKSKTIAFLAFRNALRVFYKRAPLSDIFAQHGHVIVHYGAALEEGCKEDPQLAARLAEREKDAEAFSVAEPESSTSYTDGLLDDLMAGQDWDHLRVLTQRNLASPDLRLARKAARLYSLSLANSTETADKLTACEMYRGLLGSEAAEPTDAGILALLLLETGQPEEAKSVLLSAFDAFPANAISYFLQIGLKLVDATGDRSFRKQLTTTAEARGARG